MSAPDQKDWAMTDAEIESVQYDADLYGVESDEVQAPILAVARRRALAELKALAPSVCRRCAVAYPVAGQFVGDYWHQAEKCQAGRIHDRIAEIEAEG